jgi:hypothetical protein
LLPPSSSSASDWLLSLALCCCSAACLVRGREKEGGEERAIGLAFSELNRLKSSSRESVHVTCIRCPKYPRICAVAFVDIRPGGDSSLLSTSASAQ